MPELVFPPPHFPQFPDPAPTIEMSGVRMELVRDDDRYCPGPTLLRDETRQLRITDVPGRVIADVGLAWGGPIYIQIGPRVWTISVHDFAALVIQAEAAQYAPLKESQP